MDNFTAAAAGYMLIAAASLVLAGAFIVHVLLMLIWPPVMRRAGVFIEASVLFAPAGARTREALVEGRTKR